MNNQYLVTSAISNAIKNLESITIEHKIDKEEIKSDLTLTDLDIENDTSQTSEKPRNKFRGWIVEIAKRAHIDLQNGSFNEDIFEIKLYFGDILEEQLDTFIKKTSYLYERLVYRQKNQRSSR